MTATIPGTYGYGVYGEGYYGGFELIPPITFPYQWTPFVLTIDGLDVGFEQSDGSALVCDTLDGWFSGPGSRSNFTDRPTEHGSFDAPVYRTNRVITAGGWAVAESRARLMAMLHDALGVLAEGQLGTVRVNDPDFGDFSVQAHLTDGPLIAPAGAFAWTWQIQVTAPDPRLYGAPVSKSTKLPEPGAGGLKFPLFKSTGTLRFGTPGSSGRVTLTNPGTADTTAKFQVTGPILGGVSMTFADTNRRIVYAGDIPSSGVLLVIDSATGRATLNGSDRTGDLTVRQWQLIRKQSSVDVQFATLGAAGQSGTLTATIQPAYW